MMLARIPPATRLLLLANGLLFLLQQRWGDSLLVHLALWPWGMERLAEGQAGLLWVGFRPWQLLSYAFLHGSLTHFLCNMLALFTFGASLERVLGSRYLLGYYLVCVLSAGLCQEAVTHWLVRGDFAPTIGASGGVFGFLLAFGMFFPHQRLMLFLLPVPLPAWLFVILYALAELLFGVTGMQRPVAHFAHLGGMLGGYAMLVDWRHRTRRASSR